MLEASSSIVKYFGLRAYRDRTVIKTNFTQGRTGRPHLSLLAISKTMRERVIRPIPRKEPISVSQQQQD
jgi:hypothetical protein